MIKQEELIRSLGRMKVQTGSLVCLGCGHEHNCGISGCAIIRAAQEFIAKAPKERTVSSSGLFDKREIYPDCTVEVLTNTITGEQSVGWYENSNPPAGVEEDEVRG